MERLLHDVRCHRSSPLATQKTTLMWYSSLSTALFDSLTHTFPPGKLVSENEKAIHIEQTNFAHWNAYDYDDNTAFIGGTGILQNVYSGLSSHAALNFHLVKSAR